MTKVSLAKKDGRMTLEHIRERVIAAAFQLPACASLLQDEIREAMERTVSPHAARKPEPKPQKKPAKHQPSRDKIIRYVRNHPGKTVHQIAKGLGRKSGDIASTCTAIVKAGDLSRRKNALGIFVYEARDK